MPRWSIAFVRFIDRLNYRVGRFAMYLLFVLMAILMWSTVTKAVSTPSLWTLEMAQFVMVAYYILGGPYSMQMGSHVRMDLIYARFTHKGQALTDIFTVFCLMFYLGVMLYGAFDSTVYAFEMGERNPSAWRPVLWPLKSIITLAFGLMLLQSVAILIRDVATLRGEKI